MPIRISANGMDLSIKEIFMKRRDFLKTLSIGAAAISAPTLAYSRRRNTKAKKPNIVYIMLDELG